MRALLPALMLAVLVAGLAVGAAATPPETGQMAVVFPPFTDELTAWSLVREAGGLIVAPTALANIVVAYAPDPRFKARIQALGALFFVAAQGLCGPLPSNSRTLS